MSETLKVGKIKDAHGLKGELYVIFYSGEAAWLASQTWLRIIKDDKSIAITLEYYQSHREGMIVKVEEINNRTEAEKLKGFEIEIPTEILTSKSGESIYLHEIKGFDVVANESIHGKITDFSSNGVQDLLMITTEGGEFPVPFVKDFVLKTDFNNRVMHLQVPDGLFE